MNKKEQWTFLQKTARLLESSIPMEESLGIAGRNMKRSGAMKEVTRIQSSIAGGRSLGETLKEGTWNMATVSLIAAGEISGTLSSGMLRASENMKMHAEQRSRLLSSLFYPAIISLLALCMMIFLIAFVYPKLIPMFSGMKASLPLSTRIMIKASSFIGDYWIWMIAVIFTFIFALWFLILKYAHIRIWLETVICKMPVVGKVIVLSQFSEASFILGSLTSGGIPPPQALEIASYSMMFISHSQLMIYISKEMEGGMSFSECINNSNIFPSDWSDLVSVGEKTGSLPETFLNISKMHREEVDEIMLLVNKLIEPLMMILVGGIVGFIALSIITPMYSLTGQVHG
jgi:type II secretory pathway component PulF